jgi:hypothetical protein
MGKQMESKIPAIVFWALGGAFIVFSKQVAAGIRWLDQTIWNEKRRGQFPGFGGMNPPRWGVVLLGASWIVCGIVFWFTSKR